MHLLTSLTWRRCGALLPFSSSPGFLHHIEGISYQSTLGCHGDWSRKHTHTHTAAFYCKHQDNTALKTLTIRYHDTKVRRNTTTSSSLLTTAVLHGQEIIILSGVIMRGSFMSRGSRDLFPQPSSSLGRGPGASLTDALSSPWNVVKPSQTGSLCGDSDCTHTAAPWSCGGVHRSAEVMSPLPNQCHIWLDRSDHVLCVIIM